MIRILIIEGQTLLRLGLVNAISQSPVMEVCGDSADGKEGMDLVAKTLPDIVVVNICLPDMGGIEAMAAIKQQFNCKVVILMNQTSLEEQEVLTEVLNVGADSYLLTSCEPEILRYALLKTYENECWIDPKLSKLFLGGKNQNKMQSNKGKKFGVSLTPTELRTLKLMAVGLSNEQIAKILNVSEGTVKCYIHGLNQKLEAQNRVHAVMRATVLGYLNYNAIILDALIASKAATVS